MTLIPSPFVFPSSTTFPESEVATRIEPGYLNLYMAGGAAAEGSRTTQVVLGEVFVGDVVEIAYTLFDMDSIVRLDFEREDTHVLVKCGSIEVEPEIQQVTPKACRFFFVPSVAGTWSVVVTCERPNTARKQAFVRVEALA